MASQTFFPRIEFFFRDFVSIERFCARDKSAFYGCHDAGLAPWDPTPCCRRGQVLDGHSFTVGADDILDFSLWFHVTPRYVRSDVDTLCR